MALNLFKLCSGLRVLGYFMILLVGAIIAVSYYAVVVLAWGPRLLHGGMISVLAFFIVAVFHVLLVLLTWSYFMVVFRDPGSVPGNWKPILDEESMEAGGSMPSQQYVSAQPSSCPTEGMERRPCVRGVFSRWIITVFGL
ncbi:hypothetical protein IFM89_009683 [Coptis chinensis]|uniref:Palmitoyltransferase n=1 Tax=Coptis chinensis TaxID=261450 RepID=A0A835MDM4_9MAGN|nr:hypothetical protein IFM89_009683 [Coptis chinensis]